MSNRRKNKKVKGEKVMCIEDKIREIMNYFLKTEYEWKNNEITLEQRLKNNDKIMIDFKSLFNAKLKKEWEAWRGHCEYYLYFKCTHCENKKSECNFPECPVRKNKLKRKEVSRVSKNNFGAMQGAGKGKGTSGGGGKNKNTGPGTKGGPGYGKGAGQGKGTGRKK